MTSFTESRTGTNANLVIGFDADDMLWHNEIYYRQAAEKFNALLAPHKDPAQTVKSCPRSRSATWLCTVTASRATRCR